MGKILRSELLKLRKSSIWLLIFVSPALSTVIGYAESAEAPHEWMLTLTYMAFTHGLLFLPLLTGVFSAFVCRYEHTGGGWKQLLAMPVSRGKVYLAKLMLVIGLLLATQLLFAGGYILAGLAKGYEPSIPWKMIGTSIFGGLVACLPLAALQLFVSTAWSSFAAPLAINVIFTLPNILVVNSEKYGPYYPWAQPFLAMLPSAESDFGAMNVSLETLLFVIAGSFLLFFASGFPYFLRKEV
ncbi:ABC transporter permease [Mesobacillus foraminis]|uniref:ABC transporter permease n=1 Tax=Mesobacillus foraminis TaxID=279826 RepID=UPI000EF54E93|nr:ABC transporter permease [Mesobacillus foraminis]